MTATLLAVDEVSVRLAVSPRTVRQLVATRRLAAVRVGRLVRVRPEALAAYIASNETQVEPGEQPAPLAQEWHQASACHAPVFATWQPRLSPLDPSEGVTWPKTLHPPLESPVMRASFRGGHARAGSGRIGTMREPLTDVNALMIADVLAGDVWCALDVDPMPCPRHGIPLRHRECVWYSRTSFGAMITVNYEITCPSCDTCWSVRQVVDKHDWFWALKLNRGAQLQARLETLRDVCVTKPPVTP